MLACGALGNLSTLLVPTVCPWWLQDAQNAAATRALYELAAGDARLREADPPLWAQLPPTFQELWLVWQDEGEDSAAAAETEEAVAARDAFVQQLLSRGAGGQVTGAALGRGQEAADAGGGDGGGWREALLSAVAAAASKEAQQEERQRLESERLLQEQLAWRASEEGRRWIADRAK